MSDFKYDSFDIKMINQIDFAIRDLIIEINNHPDFETLLSCAGHYNLCPAFKKEYKWFDDFDIDDNLYDHDDIVCEKYCSGTLQPCLYFRIKNLYKYIEFIAALKNKEHFTYPFIVNVKNDIVYYLYSNGDGERYEVDCDKYSIYPQFKEFWQNFITKWKIYVDPNSNIKPITQFPLNNYSQCYNCHKKTSNVQKINNKSFLDVDLFGEEHIISMMDYEDWFNEQLIKKLN